MKKYQRLLFTLMMVSLSAAAQITKTVDFNTSGEIFTEFNTTGNIFGNGSGTGLGGTNSASTPAFFTTGTSVLQDSFSGDSSSIEVSLYFQFATPTADASFGTALWAGIGPSSTYEAGLASGGSDSHLLVGLQGRTTTGANSGNPITKYFMSFNEKVDGTVSNFGGSTLTNDLVVGNWYYLDVSITYDVNGYDITASLSDSDSNGVLGGVLAGGTISATDRTIASLSGDSEIYSFMGGSGNRSRGIGVVDHYSLAVIPEPSSIALSSVALAAGWLAFRRRRS